VELGKREQTALMKGRWVQKDFGNAKRGAMGLIILGRGTEKKKKSKTGLADF